uniref:Uncharacterized protein n=1 Tax=Aquisalinus luteolus TaxID=1566827 RepID=A0A8J3A0X8_9PROT|nr:hypothetical protein GCM10011355_07800 [Aquisalinus luteolus]
MAWTLCRLASVGGEILYKALIAGRNVGQRAGAFIEAAAIGRSLENGTGTLLFGAPLAQRAFLQPGGTGWDVFPHLAWPLAFATAFAGERCRFGPGKGASDGGREYTEQYPQYSRDDPCEYELR